jgi:hypothetical protein
LYGGTLGRKKGKREKEKRKKRKEPASEGGRYLRGAVSKRKRARHKAAATKTVQRR